jgi:hypothetical protein
VIHPHRSAPKMYKLNNHSQGKNITLITLILSASLVGIFSVITPAQDRGILSDALLIPAGTTIPVKYDKGNKILLTREETLSLTLTVADNIKNLQGVTIIPGGSKIIGEIKPQEKGSQFISEMVMIGDKEPKSQKFDAISEVITRIEKLIKGGNPERVIKGAVLGHYAQAVIASLRDNKPISSDFLRYGGLEALGGWLLRGESIDLVSIDPDRDLKLTLRSDFAPQ